MNEGEKGSLDRLVDDLAAEIDVTLIDQQLRRSPEERIEHMLGVLRFVEELRRARGPRTEDAD